MHTKATLITKMFTIKITNKVALNLYIITLLSSSPFIPKLNNLIQKQFKGLNYKIYYSIPIIICGGGLFFLITVKKDIKKSIYIIIILFAYLFFLKSLKYPVEAAHFTEYGILTYFSCRQMEQYTLHKFKKYLLSITLVLLIGIIDESIQHLLPNRVGELNDIKTNLISGGLALSLYWTTLEKKNDC